MKRIYVILLLLLSFIGCRDDAVVMYDNITTRFNLYNSSGEEATEFRSGEDFEMKFSITNLSGEDLSYHYTGVPVVYEIYHCDTVFSTSVDGLVFAQVIVDGKIKDGETYTDSWLAPNAKYLDPEIELPAGEYKAYVGHGSFFDNHQIEETAPIFFTIIE